MSDTLYVCISLDVEEEGLFSGHYASRNPPLTNIPLLAQLAPLLHELDFRLTFFCDYAVFADSGAWAAVSRLAESQKVEIGAHLHHWSTPPFSANGSGEPLRTHLLPPRLLRERLENLLEKGKERAGHPLASFRMGRWDLRRQLLPLLAEHGIKVDSSICPLRAFKNGPSHFLAPAEPYWVGTPAGRILEAPITQIPIFSGLERIWMRLWTKRQAYLDSWHFFGALSANPVWHSLPVMKMAARRHFARGGRVLNFFWHSSELLPGASPNIPDQQHAARLLQKIFTFCKWLRLNFKIQPLTASEIAALPIAARFPQLPEPADGDW
ncbi:MAG: hypothetical protein HDQ91_00715 [Desulfovibrio sp.]|nr:hypothetical protein [Desulfovibrio sp.]